MKAHIENLGEHGIFPDILGRQLPPNAWTRGANMSTYAGAISSVLGYKSTIKTPDSTPYFILPVSTATGQEWFYAGFDTSGVLTLRRITDTATETDVSRATAYTGTFTDRFTGDVLGERPIFTNGVDEPQIWDPGTSLFKDLSNITGWDAGDTAQIVRVFRQFVILFDITESGTRYKSLIRWSSPADPGSEPTTFDETDTANIAGRTSLETNSPIVEALPLGEDLYLYTHTSVWRMTLIDSSLVFDIAPVFDSFGAAATGCVVSTGDGRHIVFTGTDVVEHDGGGHKSLLQGQFKRSLPRRVTPDSKERSFVAIDEARSEALICYPRQGSSQTDPQWPDEAFLVNWETGDTGFRQIPVSASAAVGDLEDYESDETWNSVIRMWNAEFYRWNDRFRQSRSTLILCGVDDSKFFGYGLAYTFDDAEFSCTLERRNLTLPEKDPDQVVTLTKMYPKIKVGAADSVDFYIGTAFEEEGGITWSGPYAFNPDTDRHIDPLVTGVWISMRMQYRGTAPITFSGYSLEWEEAGWR